MFFQRTYKKINKKIIDRQSGFTLLFAVLVSVLILTVGISIINLSLKQIALSGVARESQFAFYAANTGAECAFFWDVRLNLEDSSGEPVSGVIFATSSASSLLDNDFREYINCAQSGGDQRSIFEDLTTNPGETKVYYSQPFADSATTTFWIDFDYNSDGEPDPGELPYCAKVVVEKWQSETSQIRTRISSYGYNTCDEDNPRRTERGLVITY